MKDLAHLPIRLVTGSYILHSGWEKWHAGDETAEGVHGMAASAYPVLEGVEPPRFLRLLAGAEIGLGAALLNPAVPAELAGAALTGFSGALLGLYARVPGLRREGSIWPDQRGVAISKDVWMLGIGLSLLAGGLSRRRRRS